MKMLLFIATFLVTTVAYSGNFFDYEVKESETIESISQQFRLEKDVLLSANEFKSSPKLTAGQKIFIPVSFDYYEPIVADLNTIFYYSPLKWRNNLFEVYRWNKSSKVLIFDTINYTVQSEMFKRLAFYVEKKDFRGGIYNLEELKDLKGWNGHDYRSEDLASFYNKIKKENLKMTTGEKFLLEILLKTRTIVVTRRGYISGSGAVLSYSRSSSERHRRYILEHEAFHGLFFTFSGFRSFSVLVWNNMSKDEKKIWKMYLDYLGYDSDDKRLTINEFIAYMLQTTKKEDYDYFMELIYYRLRRKYPDKRKYIETFYKNNPKPFRKEIDKLDKFIGKINID